MIVQMLIALKHYMVYGSVVNMISQSKTFCPCPWTSLNIDQMGRVKPCLNSYEGELSLGNINQTAIQDIVTGATLTDLKQTIAQGKWHALCGGCQRAEAQGITSARTNRQVSKEQLDQIDLDINYFQLTDLTVNWSNLCNLTCTYCNPLTSTAWQAALKQPISLIKNSREDLIQLAEEHAETITGLTLGGGEPLLQRGLAEFLSKINPAKTHVMITTNLSVNLSTNPVYQELRHWPSVNWLISFDNVNADKFEYVRNGSSWSLFTANIQLLKQNGQHVVAHPAYSVYCALDLVEYYRFCQHNELDIFWCDLTYPEVLDIRQQSATVRQQAQAEIDRVLELYSDSDSTTVLDLPKLIDYRRQLDLARGTIDTISWHNQQELTLTQQHSFTQLWPEFNS